MGWWSCQRLLWLIRKPKLRVILGLCIRQWLYRTANVYKTRRKRRTEIAKTRMSMRTRKGLVMVGNQQMKARDGPESMKVRNPGKQKQSVILYDNWNKVLICREYWERVHHWLRTEGLFSIKYYRNNMGYCQSTRARELKSGLWYPSGEQFSKTEERRACHRLGIEGVSRLRTYGCCFCHTAGWSEEGMCGLRK